MKKKIITAMAVIASVGVCGADVLFSSGFDGNTGSTVLSQADNSSGPTTVGITDWTTDASVTVISGLTVINTDAGGTPEVGGFVQLTHAENLYATGDNILVNQNLNLGDDTGIRGYSLTFTTDTSWDLSNLNVRAGHATNKGANQNGNTDLNYVLSGGTLGADVSGVILQQDYAPEGFLSLDFDLTGTTIGAGNYTLEVYQQNLNNTGGAYAIYDGITLEAIPEPATMGLVAAVGGSLLFIRRRRLMS